MREGHRADDETERGMSVVLDIHTLLDDIVRTGDVRSLLQPIVDLATGATVAYEARTPWKCARAP